MEWTGTTDFRLRHQWARPFTVMFLALLFLFPFPLLAGKGNPWEFLRDFALVPGSLAHVEEGYLTGLYRNLDKGMVAVVIYRVDCGLTNCTVRRPVAYAAYRLSEQGPSLFGFHIDPSEKEIGKLISEAVCNWNCKTL